MIIGFTERSQTVSEEDTLPGEDMNLLPIHVATQSAAEREHPMIFRILEASSSAIVEPLAVQTNPLYDALFGSRDNIDDPIEVFFVLEALHDVIPPVTALIRNDFRPEDEECFTIHIFPVDLRRRELFACNEDDSGADNYFCQTEICICSKDGRFTFASHWSRL